MSSCSAKGPSGAISLAILAVRPTKFCQPANFLLSHRPFFEDEFRDSPLAELPKSPKLSLEFDDESSSDEFAEEAASLYQRWTRQRDEESQQETLHGILRADFAAGDPLVILHVSFCPVLESIPELQCEVSGDLSPEAPDATIKITLAETFGARIEVRLQQKPSAPLSLFVELFGTAPKTG